MLSKATSEGSKFLHTIVAEPCYVSYLLLHEDLEFPYLAKHIRNPAQSFNLNILDSENLPVWKLRGMFSTQGMNNHSSTALWAKHKWSTNLGSILTYQQRIYDEDQSFYFIIIKYAAY